MTKRLAISRKMQLGEKAAMFEPIVLFAVTNRCTIPIFHHIKKTKPVVYEEMNSILFALMHHYTKLPRYMKQICRKVWDKMWNKEEFEAYLAEELCGLSLDSIFLLVSQISNLAVETKRIHNERYAKFLVENPEPDDLPEDTDHLPDEVDCRYHCCVCSVVNNETRESFKFEELVFQVYDLIHGKTSPLDPPRQIDDEDEKDQVDAAVGETKDNEKDEQKTNTTTTSNNTTNATESLSASTNQTQSPRTPTPRFRLQLAKRKLDFVK